jgi:hypothetical protein
VPAIRIEVTVCVDCPYCMVPGGGKGAREPRPSSPIHKERAIRVTDVGTPQKEETSPRGDSNGKESPHPPETSMEGV